MKVNIIGRYNGEFLRGVGILPVYERELSPQEIYRLLNFNKVKIYDAASGGLLNLKTFKANYITGEVETPKKEKPFPKKKPVVVNTINSITNETAQRFAESIEKEEKLPEIPKEAYVEPHIELETAPVEVVEELKSDSELEMELIADLKASLVEEVTTTEPTVSEEERIIIKDEPKRENHYGKKKRYNNYNKNRQSQ